jgi:hypothetical protein|tara:strand:+ start:148 stop:858 length:711 start_codon:yes stop_codon:yes gene_type:complete
MFNILKKIKKKDLEIQFIATDSDMEKIWPPPKPATHFIPQEYKNMPRFANNDMKVLTVKACVPFLDAMTAGYIIPFDQDYVIDPTDTDFTFTPANFAKVETHPKQQLLPEWESIIGENAGKFENKWLIKTPPGYSCLFVHPMNRNFNPDWTIISGVVDTDSYIIPINFPFILRKRDKQFLIKKGDPMVQVIPFKRETWKMWKGFYFEKEHGRGFKHLTSLMFDRYKRIFWKKKSFK